MNHTLMGTWKNSNTYRIIKMNISKRVWGFFLLFIYILKHLPEDFGGKWGTISIAVFIYWAASGYGGYASAWNWVKLVCVFSSECLQELCQIISLTTCYSFKKCPQKTFESTDGSWRFRWALAKAQMMGAYLYFVMILLANIWVETFSFSNTPAKNTCNISHFHFPTSKFIVLLNL